MSDLAAALGHYGVGLVFVNVLLTQLGAPLPAVPVMIVAGAVAAGGHMSGWQAFAVAVIASSIADAL